MDEFQDVSPLQIGLLKLLVDPQNPRITVCGDQDQSIYGFLAGKASSNFQVSDSPWRENLQSIDV